VHLRLVVGYGRAGPNGYAVVALTLALLAPARSLRMDEWVAQSWSARWRTTSFRRTTSVRANWINSTTWTLQPPEPRLANDRKRNGHSRYQVYYLRPPGGLPGGLLLVGDGLHGFGKSQRRALGRRACRSLPRFAVRLEVCSHRSVVLMLYILTLTLIYLYSLLARSLETRRISYQLPITSRDRTSNDCSE